MNKKQRRGSQTGKGSQRKLVSSPSQEEDDDGGEGESTSMRRRSSLQRATLSTESEEESISTPELASHKAPVVLSAEIVCVEPVQVISKPPKKQTAKRRKSRAQRQEKEAAVEERPSSHSESNSSKATQPERPKYPRSFLGMVVRIVKILHALLNIIVVRGSVLTRRNLNSKLEDYLLQSSSAISPQQVQQQHEVVAFYEEHISHHLFVFYLSWGRLLVCLIVLMWGTCTNRLPKPIAIYIGMAMHWIDSIRALDSSNWLPSSSDTEDDQQQQQQHDYDYDPHRSATAEEEVQTAMAWLHLFWFLVDGFYCRQILHKRRYEEQRLQREMHLAAIQVEAEELEETEEEEYRYNKQSKRD
mmetsp:Transcript_41421/g.99779  ORF Transcript_41421/g.99779 Transcript_41421/m.99779 type:complete len:358 (-) Transcript_41421:68-1141(-)|eukprot:CAMPEP_0113629368 /NCGR_PEP_ID=MMETSP0017_2-20120614/15243_1 /TAXON_ID=2856 /ORGANISM="Cylindrotheca closterium" /LENGTH=357 /DNA_ID=CAMNT_0000539759 /DNA_START=118 /DNA_END=1191 /DNA_ORIENTATION=- /assembly_acc=CAM_ASM_000147